MVVKTNDAMVDIGWFLGEGSLQVTIKTNLLAELKHQAPN